MEYTIKEFSEKVNVTPHTLRYYEKEGLLPSTKRLNNRHRVYNEIDASWIMLIRCLRSTGMSVNALRHYVELCGQGDKTAQERKQIILNQKRKIEEQLQQLKEHLELINKKLNIYDEIISKQTPSAGPITFNNGSLSPAICEVAEDLETPIETTG